MLKPDFVTPQDWKILLSYCSAYNVNPYLIIGIGLHETGWGTLGWGKEDYILGVGCFTETHADPAMKGFETQINWACQALGKFFGIHPTKSQLEAFAGKIWRPGNPLQWANGVWNAWLKVESQFGADFKDFKDIPDYAREPVNYLFTNSFLFVPFGSDDFYRSMTVIYRVIKMCYSHFTI